MKHCPKCKAQYPDDMNFCLIDGESLLQNDPDAITLIGKKPAKPSRLKTISIRGQAIQQTITLHSDRPFTFIHPQFTVVILLKGLTTHPKNDVLTAYVVFYGEHRLIPGPYVERPSPNEFFMPEPEYEFADTNDFSIFHFTLSQGRAKLFRAFIDSIDRDKGNVRLRLSLLITSPQ